MSPSCGRALMEIRDRRLYRETHATFEAYCGERWGWTARHVNRQMDAAAVTGAIGPMGPKPENERQARAMLSNLDSEEREQVRERSIPAKVGPWERSLCEATPHPSWIHSLS